MGIKALLVDDHELLLDSLEIILKEIDENLQVLKAKTCKAASEIISHEEDLSLVLLDLNLPDASGINLLLEFTAKHPLLPIIILSSSEDPVEMQQCLNSGALGFIPKTSSAKVIVNAVRLVMAGGIYIPKELLSSKNGHDAQKSKLNLTPRQHEVFKLLISGISNKEIANNLSCTEATIKTHITAVLKALGVANRTQAALAAQKMGYIR
ncbi:MAG: response regulator transcription factor [Gammaproteobacteria bacterium]|nr:response regulator transcription factor [Gammaproteobacteria bacterium]